MKKNLRFPLMVLMGAALAGVLLFLIYRDVDRAAGVETYHEAAKLAGVPDLEKLLIPAPQPTPTPAPAPAESGPAGAQSAPTQEPEPSPTPAPPQDPVFYFRALEDVDLAALRAYSPEVLGWIAIPGVLSYPLMRGEDNSFYLNHTWNGTASAVGAIFMDYRSNADLGDFNTLIYGHRTLGRAMFGSLAQYSSQDFWAAHPDVYLVTDEGIARYRIYAAYEAELTSATYQNQFSSDASKENFVNHGLEQSVIDAGAAPDLQGRVITLSTCTNTGHSTRWVVQAFRAEG